MISIIGAGPAGNYLAYLLAKNGKKVRVFEEHNEIGKPVQCTGLFTGSIEKILEMKKEFVVNRIKKARVIVKDKEIEFKLKKENIVVDRKKFDKYLAEKAMEEGAEYFLNSRFIDYKIGEKIKFKINNKEYETDYLIGADGPFSKISKSINKGKARFVSGLQARVNLKHEKELIDFYLDDGLFGWVVPENEKVARVGIVSYGNVNEHFKSFLRRFGKVNVKEYQSGLIPIYNRKIKANKGNIFLVGDAAAHVKATSFGGVIYGLMGAEELCNAILKKKDYNRLWRRRFGKELLLSLYARKILDKFSLKDYEKLISLLNKSKVKEILEKYDRDFPSKILLRIVLKEPRLGVFAKFLF